MSSKFGSGLSTGLRRATGFTTLELAIAMGITALTVVTAIPMVGMFTHRNQCLAAARELSSAAEFARSRAQDTGQVTTLVINGTAQCKALPVAVSAVAWAVLVRGQPVADRCLTTADYQGRYGRTQMVTPTETISFLPLGIANPPSPAPANGSLTLKVVFSSIDVHQQISTLSIYPGGATHVDNLQG